MRENTRASGLDMGSAGAPARSRVTAALLALGALILLLLNGCAVVKPFEREKLADPIMDPGAHLSKQTMEQKFFSTVEGSAGGGTGLNGGCGCSK